MEWNIMPEFCALIILIIVWMYEKKGNNIPSFKNRVFKLCLMTTFMGISSNIISTIMIEHYKELPIWATWIVTTIYFIFIPLMGMIYFYYVVASIYIKYKEIKNVLLIASIPTFFYFIAIIFNFFTKLIFDISPEKGYVRGELIGVTYLIFYFYCLAIVFLVAYKYKKIEQKTIRILLMFPMLSTLIVIIQQTHKYIILSGFSASCALLIVYLYLQNKQIYIDYLTKIPNRGQLLNMLDFQLQSGKKKEKIALIVISLREFKIINDRYGQQIGDIFLQEISKLLCKISPKESVYRFNGDEFAVLLSGESYTNIEQYVNQVQEEMNKMWRIGEYSTYLSIAIGIVRCSSDNRTVESIIQSVEYAVAMAKKKKNNYICFFDDKVLKEMKRKKIIAEILREKLKEESFEMYYQPIYDVETKKFLYLESLIRINDSPIGPIYPNEFIPIAEETGIIIEMTYVILDKVCKFIKSVIDNKIPIRCVHVNFSPLQFSQMDLEERVIEIIKKNGIPSNTIKIEFTESALADSTESVIKFSKEMKKHGIKMGLDDFGTGYSNVSTVMSIPFHTVKLDKSLVWMAMKSDGAAIMFRNIIGAFKGIGMQLVAEGIETEEQKKAVIDFEVEQIQGYYFSKPLPREEALQFLKENSK